jgi:hypothetical protein
MLGSLWARRRKITLDLIPLILQLGHLALLRCGKIGAPDTREMDVLFGAQILQPVQRGFSMTMTELALDLKTEQHGGSPR